MSGGGSYDKDRRQVSGGGSIRQFKDADISGEAAMNGTRRTYFDLIRIAACFLVIVVHVSSVPATACPVDTFDYQAGVAYNTLAIVSPALFFMLSGALFLHPASGKVTLKQIWGKYILRLTVAYIFWSNLFTFVAWAPYYTFSWGTVKLFVKEFFTGTPMYHLWFIPAIVAIYMVLPLLQAAFAERRNCRYYLLLFLVVQVLLPTLQKLELPNFNMLLQPYSRIPFFLCMGNVGYFVLGYYLSTEAFTRRARRAVYILGVAGTVAAVGMEEYISVRQNMQTAIFSDLFSLNTLLLACAVFVGARYAPWRLDRAAVPLEKLSRLTFGIYLVHPLFINIMADRCAFLDEINVILRIPIAAAAIFLCSAPVAWCISKIPVVGKYIA